MTGVWDNDKLIRVDMTALTVSIEDYPADWKYLGGAFPCPRGYCWKNAIPPVILWVRITFWCWRQAFCRELRRPPRGVCP